MAIITHTRRQQLIDEQARCNTRAISRPGDEGEAYRELAWEIRFAFDEVDFHSLEAAIWRAKHPNHRHIVPNELGEDVIMTFPSWLCPVCHEQPYNPRLDIESPAVQ